MAGPTVDVQVDGSVVTAEAGATVLDACDAAGRYVPRLCHFPGLASCCDGTGGGQGHASLGTACGVCAVRVGDGTVVLACSTPVAPGMEISTDDSELRALRLERLASILARHPHVCLSCPDREGCARDECTYGVPPEARCCSELGRCELGKLARFIDTALAVPRLAVAVTRDAAVEGRIRREPGLCIGCGRCVRVCTSDSEAGSVLLMEERSGAAGPGEAASGAVLVAAPKQGGGLRVSGCTFCGLCVMVCPTGALTAPGEAGARWLAVRRAKSGLRSAVFAPENRGAFSREQIDAVPREPGVFQLLDDAGQVLRISGVADLRDGVTEALADPGCAAAAYFQVELEQLYTQRESELLAKYAQEQGHLPPGNDLGDDLFTDEDD